MLYWNARIKDVSNNGYYHNKKFVETAAEAYGMHIEHCVTYGWTITTLAKETAAWMTR